MKFSPLSMIVVFLSSFGNAEAQQTPVKIAVYVHATAEDPVGRTLIYEVREAVRRSSGLALADRDSDTRFILRVVTSDPDSNRGKSASVSTVYSAAYTMQTLYIPGEMFLTNAVGKCGLDKVESCARIMTAKLDEQAAEFRRAQRNAFDSTINHSR